MKLTFIGSGSAFTVGGNNFKSNMILESNNHKKLLIDCGSDARLALHELSLSYRDIDAVYISHLHADHCGGLEWLALSKFYSEGKKIDLFIHPDLRDSLWQMLSVSLNGANEKTISLDSFFTVHLIQNRDFVWEECTIRIFPTIHVQNQSNLMPSYGLELQINEQKILITTDTQFASNYLEPLYKQAAIIFHDCEIGKEMSEVHACYYELKKLSPDIKKKMWLYHYQPLPLPNALADGFQGFVKKGQSFKL